MTGFCRRIAKRCKRVLPAVKQNGLLSLRARRGVAILFEPGGLLRCARNDRVTQRGRISLNIYGRSDVPVGILAAISLLLWMCLFPAAITAFEMPSRHLSPSFSISPDAPENTLTEQYILIRSVGGFGLNRGRFSSPHGIAGDAQYLFIADTGNNRIVRTDHDLTVFDYFQELPDTFFQLDAPQDLAIHNRRVWAADSRNHRLVHYDHLGQFRDTLGALGLLESHFDHPSAIDTDDTGNLIVADTNNQRIQIFSPEGEFRREFGQTGADHERLHAPSGVLALKNGQILVSDAAEGSIKLYSEFGLYLKTLFAGKEMFRSPRHMAADINGNIYVADPEKGEVIVFTSDETLIAVIREGLSQPVSVFCFADRVYVTDRGHHRIVMYRRKK